VRRNSHGVAAEQCRLCSLVVSRHTSLSLSHAHPLEREYLLPSMGSAEVSKTNHSVALPVANHHLCISGPSHKSPCIWCLDMAMGDSLDWNPPTHQTRSQLRVNSSLVPFNLGTVFLSPCEKCENQAATTDPSFYLSLKETLPWPPGPTPTGQHTILPLANGCTPWLEPSRPNGGAGKVAEYRSPLKAMSAMSQT